MVQYTEWQEGGYILGLHGLGGGGPDRGGGLGVEQLVPQAATDQVGSL